MFILGESPYTFVENLGRIPFIKDVIIHFLLSMSLAELDYRSLKWECCHNYSTKGNINNNHLQADLSVVVCFLLRAQ